MFSTYNHGQQVKADQELVAAAVLSRQFILDYDHLDSVVVATALTQVLYQNGLIYDDEESSLFKTKEPFTIIIPEFECDYGFMLPQVTIEFVAGQDVEIFKSFTDAKRKYYQHRI